MRRFLFSVVIASITAAMPNWASAGDREIAKAVMAKLQQHKAAGSLKGFDIDMQVEDGVVYIDGHVASRAQRALIAQAAADAVGVGNLVNKIKVKAAAPAPAPAPKSTPTVRPAAAQQTAAKSADATLTDSIIGKLSKLKQAGHLRGFDLDVSTNNRDVWLKGSVSSPAHKKMILETASRTRGVARVIDDIKVRGAVRQASTGGLTPSTTAPTPAPVPQGSSMPVAGQPQAMPQAFAPSGLASTAVGGGYSSGHPVAMQSASFGGGSPRYDQPNMPSYAWPSYAAHPNYAAVSYPKQYSPSAWPYIGPFYPYPQVPLGWRKVALEWDDGLWYLDFTSK